MTPLYRSGILFLHALFLFFSEVICEPVLFDVVGVPDVLWEIGRALVYVDKVDELGVEVGIAEGAVGH